MNVMRCVCLFFSLVSLCSALTKEEAARLAPLPALVKHGGAHLIDLNQDGHEDWVISNAQGYGVYLFNARERKNLEWAFGWSHILREGKPGDANSLPLLEGAKMREGILVTADGSDRLSLEELRRVPGPAPLSAEDSMQRLRLKPGYEVRLVAQEPLVRDPIYVDWDERGRMWVVEMGDYPFAAGEKTSDGKLGQGQVSELQGGRIKILEDTDGDSVMDKATLFLDGLLHPTGLAHWKGGVFVTSIPDLFYARDVDGDGRCDERKTWFTGFTAGNPQHLVNGLCWGLDGWFYGANGDSGGNVIEVATGRKIKLGTNDFRFHPETGVFEREAGRSQYGKWRDDYGNWFGNNNSTLGWHYHLPLAYAEAHPERIVTSMRAVLNEDKTLYPISPPQRRFNWASATNTLTSGCSPMPWSDGSEEWLLICEPANQLVHREVLNHAKVPITSHRHRDDVESEFIASADPWFRPCMARPGPDGAIYVVDMYRLVLEHPEWIPAELVQGLDVRAGESMGRIYRIARSADAAKPVVKGMESPIRWQRDAAQRLLLEQADAGAVPRLRQLATATEHSLAIRLQAAWTAHLLSKQDSESLIALMKSAYPKVRGAALVAAGSEEVHPEELASWFPPLTTAQAVAPLPVVTQVSADRQKVVQRYVHETSALRGDARRGEAVYQKNCIACHKLGTLGVEVGPDLATVATKPREQIIEAIFDPNRAVELRHAATLITRHDGTQISGLITAETATSLVLRLPGGGDMPLQRKDIQSMKTQSISLMPEGFESLMSPQETADLLARLQGR